MCFGGKSGPSAAEMYAKQKVNYGALPSLGTDGKVDRKVPGLKDVETPEQRTGSAQRSLINPYG